MVIRMFLVRPCHQRLCCSFVVDVPKHVRFTICHVAVLCPSCLCILCRLLSSVLCIALLVALLCASCFSLLCFALGWSGALLCFWLCLAPVAGFLEGTLAALGLSWAALGRSGTLLGRSWPLLARSRAVLGGSWPLLASSWPLLGHSWPLFGRSWPLLGRFWSLLGRSWPLLSAQGSPRGKKMTQL